MGIQMGIWGMTCICFLRRILLDNLAELTRLRTSSFTLVSLFVISIMQKYSGMFLSFLWFKKKKCCLFFIDQVKYCGSSLRLQHSRAFLLQSDCCACVGEAWADFHLIHWCTQITREKEKARNCVLLWAQPCHRRKLVLATFFPQSDEKSTFACYGICFCRGFRS